MTRAQNAGSYLTGEKGRNRVRLFPHPANGKLYLEWQDTSRRKRRRALEHRDWHLGKAQADAFAAELAAGARQADAARVMLGSLFDIYDREVTPEKTPQTQKHDRAAAKLFQACWGSSFPVMELSQLEWGRFIRARRAGLLGSGRPVGNRMIEYDLRFLLAVLNWAVKARLIPSNPRAGLEVPREYDPQQPLLSRAEYEKLQAVARGVSPRFALALTLAWETGRRIGSIRHLRWSDLDLEQGTLRFRKEFDKNKHRTRDAHVALSPTAVEALEAAQQERVHDEQAIGDGWMFPSGAQTSVPLGRRYLLKWWKKAEDRAQLPHVPRRAWHACRRAFSTELLGRGLSAEVVNALGGWARGSNVARSVYQHVQLEEQRAALGTRGA